MSPGFSVGFPTIQSRSFDAQTARNVYLLTAGGHRVELRQLGASNVYESYDSSYFQLTDSGNGLTLKTTDGTQIGYGHFANGWQATGVEDRNGNVLTIDNYWWGEIHTITDTLGRVLTFNYDGNSNLKSITQSWAGQQQRHTWVTFGWGTAILHPSIGSEVVGTYDGENVPVLAMVGFAASLSIISTISVCLLIKGSVARNFSISNSRLRFISSSKMRPCVMGGRLFQQRA